MSEGAPFQPRSRLVNAWRVSLVGRWGAIGALWPPLVSHLVVQALLSGSLGSRLVASVPHLLELAPPRSPSETSDSQNV